MVSLAIWSALEGGRPQRLSAARPETEAALEEWVKSDPSLVRDNLVVVAQQLIFPSRERLDLLCIESRSRWLVVELKRGRMAREVAAQAVDYISLLAEMPGGEFETRLAPHLAVLPRETRELVAGLIGGESVDNPRDVSAVVVGASADESLRRITSFLAERYEVPISVVELQAFRSPSGDLLIAREETGSDEPDEVPAGQPSASVEERWRRVRANATNQGFGDELSEFARIVEDAGLYVRPYTRAVMVTPEGNRGRYLAVVGFTGRADDPAADFSYGVEAFQEFFPSLTAEEVRAILGPERGRLPKADLIQFGERLGRLMKKALGSDGTQSWT